MALSNAKILIRTYEPYCRIYAIFRTPQNAGLAGTYTVACGVKCRGSVLTCVLQTFMLSLPRTKSDWLEIAQGWQRSVLKDIP